MIRISRTSPRIVTATGDALGRLAITLCLIIGTGSVALLAGLQLLLAPAISFEAAPADRWSAPALGRQGFAYASAHGEPPPWRERAGYAPSQVAQILPLPAGDKSTPVSPTVADEPAGQLALPRQGTPGGGALLPAAVAARTIEPDVTGPSTAASAGPLATVATSPVLEAERLVVQRGDTLLQILLRSGIDRAEAHEVVGTFSTLYDPRRLRVGQAMAVEFERASNTLAAPRLAALSLNLDFANDLRVERDANGDFAARRVDRELVRTIHAAHAVIDDTLYQTARRQSVPDEALVNLANIFSWDVDFQRDVHPGDSFELVYERTEDPDGEVRGGDVLFANLKLRGRHLHAYRYEHPDGRTGYYDTDGRSLRKWLMRTPIDGARLSSGFGPRRHPILGYTRMHRGVDFAAPTGTPIYAAGDGNLAEAGRNGTYGNYIEIRHNGEFSTAYAHLSRFADGIKKGGRVRQGQVIGYVGSTGRSTGPHLHYEVLQNGQQINPMAIKPRTAARLVGADLERFRRQIQTIDAKRPTIVTDTRVAQR